MHLSFEFFPPKNDLSAAQFVKSIRKLAPLQPDFLSITCGAGGSAIAGTFETVKHIRKTEGLTVIPHIAYVRQTRRKLGDVLRAYQKLGVHEVVALRGDPAVKGKEPDPAPQDTYANTVDFVADIKASFALEPIVSAYPDTHPLAQSAQQDMDHLRRKVEAGSRRAITQFFFAAETFLRFRDEVARAGIPVALTPGILPIHNVEQVLKFAKLCGAAIPAGFRQRFERWGNDPAALMKEGVQHGIELCDALRRDGVEDFHVYTLNRSSMPHEICTALGLGRAAPAIAINN